MCVKTFSVFLSVVVYAHPNIVKIILFVSGVVYAHPNIVIEDTKESVKQKHLFRCLTCEAIARQVITPESLLPGGYHYKLAMDTYKKLDPAVNYSFPLDGKPYCHKPTQVTIQCPTCELV